MTKRLSPRERERNRKMKRDAASLEYGERRRLMGYPQRIQGELIIDERCACGGLRSHHADTVSIGHGDMSARGCAKFTWAGFVPADDAAIVKAENEALRGKP